MNDYSRMFTCQWVEFQNRIRLCFFSVFYFSGRVVKKFHRINELWLRWWIMGSWYDMNSFGFHCVLTNDVNIKTNNFSLWISGEAERMCLCDSTNESQFISIDRTLNIHLIFVFFFLLFWCAVNRLFCISYCSTKFDEKYILNDISDECC